MTASGAAVDGTVLGQRQLNRALLARQHLLQRSSRTAEDALEHLVGLQSQAPNDPFLALWSRLDGFQPDHVSRLMLDRRAVRASLMRGTIHLVTSDDYVQLQPVMMPLHERGYPGTDMGKRLSPASVDEIVHTGQEILHEMPMTMKALGSALAKRWSEHDPRAMAQACRFLLPLVQVTPRGVWRASHQPTWALAGDWLGVPVLDDRAPDKILRRYLAAFGPATVADMQAWSGLTGLRTAVHGMRADLVTYRNDKGQELFDVAGAPMPDPETPAPPRFLPGFDNALLSHKDRTRIIAEERRKAIGTRNGLFAATYLVDGFVAGTWDIERSRGQATLTIRPFEHHSPETIRDLEEEGTGLLAFMHPGVGYGIVIAESR